MRILKLKYELPSDPDKATNKPINKLNWAIDLENPFELAYV